MSALIAIFQKRPMLWIFIALTLEIIILSVFSPKGGLTADSMNYLRLSESLLRGEGLFVPDLLSPDGRSFFSVWPVGYPALIALVAKLTSLELVTASKLLSILCVGGMCLVLKRMFGLRAPLFALFLLSDTVSNILYRTWSEVPFLLCMLLLVLALQRFYYQHSKRWLMLIIGASIGMYLLRYIGIMALLPIAVVGLYCLYQRRVADFFLLAMSGAVILAADLGYMQWSLHMAGTDGAVAQHANKDSLLFLLRIFTLKLLEDFKVIGISLLIFDLYYCWRKPSSAPQTVPTEAPFWPILLLTGGCYLAFLLLCRTQFFLDNFGTRLQIPGTFLLILALLDYSARHWRYHQYFAQCFTIVILGCFIYQGPVKLFTNHHRTYTQQRAEAEALYAPLPAGSIVLAGDMDMLYLRHDIQPASRYPYVGTHDDYPDANGKFREDIVPDESLAAYTKRRCAGLVKAIYVDTKRWDESILNAATLRPIIAKHPNDRLVQIPGCD